MITHSPSPGVAVSIQGIGKTYETRHGDEVRALEDINVDIRPGEFVAVLGPSGCGKSTLLSMLAGLLAPSEGVMKIDGERLVKAHPRAGVVFQTDLLLYWRTVLQNILLPIEIKGTVTDAHVARARDLLAQVGLADFADKHPSELSGGVRQRVSICRALIQQPGLLLMDEPFGALDALTREQMIIDLQQLWLTQRNTVIFITHGIDEAVFLADRVLVMSPRPGKVDLELAIDLPRPRRWSVRADPAFNAYLLQIREVFESKGVLHGSH